MFPKACLFLLVFFCCNFSAQAQQGLTGAYYQGTRFERYVLTRNDADIDFNWDMLAPAKGLPESYFSVRWTGFLKVPKSGKYLFSAMVDDGIRLWLDDQLVIDAWDLHDSERFNGTATLEAGKSYVFRVDYFNDIFEGEIHLNWQIPGTDNKFQKIDPKYYARTNVSQQPLKTPAVDVIAEKPKPKPPIVKPVVKPVVAVGPKMDTLEKYLPKNILFEQSKSVMLTGSQAELDRLSEMLLRHPEINLTIEGHTDNIGDPNKNMVLSQDRARVTARYLVEKGISGKRIDAKGYGSTRPLTTENNAAAHAKNRRVVFILR
jgi:outer membrane protein OmpA-like peptidoglycan-associated protein